MKKIAGAVLLVLIMPFFAFSSAVQTKGDITFTPAGTGKVVFSHDYHIQSRGVRCVACHIQTFSDSGAGYQMKRNKLTKRDFCEYCHNGMKGFDAKLEKNCSRCHSK